MSFIFGFHIFARLMDAMAAVQYKSMGFFDAIAGTVSPIADVCETCMRTKCSRKCKFADNSTGGCILSLAFIELCWCRRDIRLVCDINGTISDPLSEFRAFSCR